MSRQWWMVLVGVMLMVGSVQGVEAADGSYHGQSEDPVDSLMARHRLYPFFEKFGRGVSNLFGGWLEVPLNIHYRTHRMDTAGSYVTGAAIGAFRGVIRTGVGVYEMVTFFLPIPKDYVPILPTLEYFRKSPRRDRLPYEG